MNLTSWYTYVYRYQDVNRDCSVMISCFSKYAVLKVFKDIKILQWKKVLKLNMVHICMYVLLLLKQIWKNKTRKHWPIKYSIWVLERIRKEYGNLCTLQSRLHLVVFCELFYQVLYLTDTYLYSAVFSIILFHQICGVFYCAPH